MALKMTHECYDISDQQTNFENREGPSQDQQDSILQYIQTFD